MSILVRKTIHAPSSLEAPQDYAPVNWLALLLPHPPPLLQPLSQLLPLLQVQPLVIAQVLVEPAKKDNVLPTKHLSSPTSALAKPKSVASQSPLPAPPLPHRVKAQATAQIRIAVQAAYPVVINVLG